MPEHSAIGIRMKEYYESIPKFKLYRRTPVIIRLDGRSFHTFTRGFVKPFDSVLVNSMQETMKYLCENIQGVKVGYCQSDEISLLLTDYDTFSTQAFFDYEVQKVCSITASMATLAFNRAFMFEFEEFHRFVCEGSPSDNDIVLNSVYYDAMRKGAMFDSRCFNIPESEVTNYFYWRQLDSTRNSIQMIGQAHFSHKELQNKSCSMIQDMLHEEKGINWNDTPTHLKRGSCCIKVTDTIEGTERHRWAIDKEIPEFVGEGRDYIEKYLSVGE